MVDILIMIAIGIWSTLVGFGKLQLSKNSDANDEYLKKYGIIFRIGGITMCVIGILLIIIKQINP